MTIKQVVEPRVIVYMYMIAILNIVVQIYKIFTSNVDVINSPSWIYSTLSIVKYFTAFLQKWALCASVYNNCMYVTYWSQLTSNNKSGDVTRLKKCLYKKYRFCITKRKKKDFLHLGNTRNVRYKRLCQSFFFFF